MVFVSTVTAHVIWSMFLCRTKWEIIRLNSTALIHVFFFWAVSLMCTAGPVFSFSLSVYCKPSTICMTKGYFTLIRSVSAQCHHLIVPQSTDEICVQSPHPPTPPSCVFPLDRWCDCVPFPPHLTSNSRRGGTVRKQPWARIWTNGLLNWSLIGDQYCTCVPDLYK